VSDLCQHGHPYSYRSDGERVCRECSRANSREREQLISAAARHLGLTRRQFKAIHGTTRAACLAALTEPATPKPDTCRQGHPRTPDNVGWKHRPGREPTRYCMACRRDRDADAWAAVAEAADQAGVSASRYIRDHGGTLAGAATVARRNRGAEPKRPRDISAINDRFERAQQARAQVRAEAEAVWTHVATLDPDQRDWDGLSVLALCSCGWRETHGTRVEALAAASAHTANRRDARHVRGDRLDRHYQESA
jgi:hypothetical protein